MTGSARSPQRKGDNPSDTMRMRDQGSQEGSGGRGVDATSLGGAYSPGVVDLDQLARIRATVVDGLRGRLAHCQGALADRLTEATSERTVVGAAELERGRREMFEALVEIGLGAIERGEPWDGPLPAVVEAQARRAATAGMSVMSVLERCMAGFALVRDLFFEEVECHDLSRREEHALRRHATQVMDSLRRSVLRQLEQAHEHKRAQMVRSMEQRRAEIARKLLKDATPSLEETAALGGYDLDGWHTAVIATGGDATKLMRLLAAQLGCEILPASHGEQTRCALLGAQRKIAIENIERIIYDQAKDMDFSLALGEPARGLAGMRITHQEAESAALVARHEPRRITRYADVEPEATALRDKPLGDALIETYLAPLDEMSIGGEEARRTVRAFLDAGANCSKAARSLPVDRSTMHERIKKIHERLGCDLWAHRSKVERALRVEELRRRRDSEPQR